jgi:L-alanine-DL-glutamate epimerase-like enolase superfamily enzyme
VKVETKRVDAPLARPLDSSHGRVAARHLLLLRLEDAQGRVGFGEAAPLESYDGVSIEDAQAALEDCLAILRGADGRDRDEVLEECWALAVLPQAVAAVDLALWDLAGRHAGAPVWRLLGESRGYEVEVNHTLSASDRSGAAREAAQAREAGFSCLKAKVAIGDDAGRLAAIRAAAGPEMAIRLDANGAWSLAEAKIALRTLEPVGIELCEEPVRELAELTELTGLTKIPLALDESASLPGALDRRRCAAVGLKLSRCGGISGLIRTAQRARASGYDVYLTSTIDGPLGIAGALHAAAVIGPERPCGLATMSLFAGRENPLPAVRGRIAVPAGPGLGAGLRAWYQE